MCAMRSKAMITSSSTRRQQGVDKRDAGGTELQQWQVQQFKLCRRSWKIIRMVFLGEVVVIPVVVQRQVSMVQGVQNTVVHEVRQNVCVIVTGRVAT